MPEILFSSVPGLGRFPGGNGYPLQYSYLGIPMDKGAWQATVLGVIEELDTTYWLNNINISERLNRCYDALTLLWASQVMLVVKNVPANGGDVKRDVGLIPGLGRFPGGGHGIPLQYSCLENPTDRGAWRATVHRVEKSQTRLKQLSMHTPARTHMVHRLLLPSLLLSTPTGR